MLKMALANINGNSLIRCLRKSNCKKVLKLLTVVLPFWLSAPSIEDDQLRGDLDDDEEGGEDGENLSGKNTAPGSEGEQEVQLLEWIDED